MRRVRIPSFALLKVNELRAAYMYMQHRLDVHVGKTASIPVATEPIPVRKSPLFVPRNPFFVSAGLRLIVKLT